ncbi:MAG TPA: WhiB family transcriptional regulator [Kineosporiaceae bacterium]|nr:WhiB family transcriptional regulator [Kineosporiaceae bacterium]
MISPAKPRRIHSLDWQDEAACAGTDDPAFVADAVADALPALEMCAHCPVTAECFTDGRRRGGWGVWGGRYLRAGRPVRTLL